MLLTMQVSHESLNYYISYILEKGITRFQLRITAKQVYKAVSPIIRKNITNLLIYNLGNYADLEAIIEEMSAIYDKHTKQ